MEGNNMPSPHVGRGEVFHKGPGTGVVEELLEGTQEDLQAPGRFHSMNL